MKLNKQGREELRKKIEEQLQNIPEGQRVHLDKELLEELLFETITYNKNTNEKLKLPVWSGDFLRKIDLSEVSFEDVAWSLIVEKTWDYAEEAYKEFMDEETYDNMAETLPTLNHDDKVNYSYTNANIDFSKSFEYKKIGRIRLLFCNFSGIDLSKNDMSKTKSIYNCDLADTKISLLPEMFADKKDVEFGGTCLKNIDLSNFSCDAIDMISETSPFHFDCDFTNTGLNVSVNPNFNEQEESYEKEELRYMISNLSGCYVNGKLIHSLEERQAIVQEKKAEYEKMKEDLINSTLGSIEQQTSGFGRK